MILLIVIEHNMIDIPVLASTSQPTRYPTVESSANASDLSPTVDRTAVPSVHPTTLPSDVTSFPSYAPSRLTPEPTTIP